MSKMGHEVKRSKNSNNLCSSDPPPSSSFSGSRCSLGVDPQVQECWLNISPEEKVFGNDLLLDKILSYALHTNDGILDPKLVQNVRIIGKSWLMTTTKLLRKFGTPVVTLTLNDYNSINKMAIVKQKGKLLNNFIQTFTTNQGIVKSSIPFKLNLTAKFFLEENHKSLLDCFTLLRSHLFELEITFPKDGGSLPISFPYLSLPSLRKLSFLFSDELALKRTEYEYEDNIRGMWLLQSILYATEHLENLILPDSFSDWFPDEIEKRQDLEFLWLPPTISIIDVNIKLDSKGLKFLLRNDLPNLKCLTILVHEVSYKNDLLYKILERVQNTLTDFHIDGVENDGFNDRTNTYLRFPIMTHLETVKISSMNCELGPGELWDLQECLPNLKYLTVNDQSETMFEKWMNKSTFENVEHLDVSLIDDYKFSPENPNIYVSLDDRLIKGMNSSFPNIREVYLSFDVSNMNGLNSLFQNVTRLVTLQISLRGNVNDYSSDLFDSTLLCLPVALVASLREQGELIGNMEVVDCKEKSIRNLSELTELALWTTGTANDEEGSLISKLLVSHGLLKMPKLQNVVLYGKFKPSVDISKLWEDEGRSMEYDP